MAKKKQDEYESADEEIKYYDMLYDFAGVVTKANEQSFEGLEPRRIADTLRRSAEAFCKLCMVDSIAEDKKRDEAQGKPQGHKEEPPVPDQSVKSDRSYKAGKLSGILQTVQV